jgi:hypothetical protein
MIASIDFSYRLSRSKAFPGRPVSGLFAGTAKPAPGPQGTSIMPRYFCASLYNRWDGWPVSCDALRDLQRPGRVMFRVPAPTRTARASSYRGGTRRECRFAIDRRAMAYSRTHESTPMNLGANEPIMSEIRARAGYVRCLVSNHRCARKESSASTGHRRCLSRAVALSRCRAVALSRCPGLVRTSDEWVAMRPPDRPHGRRHAKVIALLEADMAARLTAAGPAPAWSRTW